MHAIRTAADAAARRGGARRRHRMRADGRLRLAACDAGDAERPAPCRPRSRVGRRADVASSRSSRRPHRCSCSTRPAPTPRRCARSSTRACRDSSSWATTCPARPPSSRRSRRPCRPTPRRPCSSASTRRAARCSACRGTARRAPRHAARGARRRRARTPSRPARPRCPTSGVDVNFGIVADVTADPSSFISGRVLGADPQAAADRVAAAVAGERGAVLSTLKHFPGHGAAPGDSHDERADGAAHDRASGARDPRSRSRPASTRAPSS